MGWAVPAFFRQGGVSQSQPSTIVLTEKNLSATRFDQHHASGWSPAGGVLGLATESCRQNLGWSPTRTKTVSISVPSGRRLFRRLLLVVAARSQQADRHVRHPTARSANLCALPDR